MFRKLVLIGVCLTVVSLAGQKRPTLREQLKNRDGLVVNVASDSLFVARFQDVIARSTVAVIGRVVDESVHLTPDESSITTDYKVRVDQLIDGQESRREITVSVPGGSMLVDRKPVRVETGQRRIAWLAPQLLLLVSNGDGYVLAPYGAFEVQDQRIRCDSFQKSLKGNPCDALTGEAIRLVSEARSRGAK